MIEWLAQYEESGELFFRIGRDGDDVVAEWLGVARLVARRDGSVHRFEPEPHADPRDIAKIQRGGVKLLLRHLEGKLALHGAAIVRDGAAIVLLGRARHGKSTLAAALCARDDVALLSDDAVAVDPAPNGRLVVAATEELHWLDAAARHMVDALTTAERRDRLGPVDDPDGKKLPIAAPRLGQGGELVALVDLAFTDGPPRISRCSALEAMTVVIPQAVRFVLDDPAIHRREIEALAQLVEKTPCFRLERPRDLALLSVSCDLVLSLLDTLQATRRDT